MGDSNLMRVGIHPFVPNTPTHSQSKVGSRGGPVGRNIVALGLLSPLLASSLESEVVAQIQSLGWRIHILALIPVGAEFTSRS